MKVVETQPTINHEQEDILKQQLAGYQNSNSDSRSTEIRMKKKIANTPFEIVGNEERGYFLAFGIFRISESKQTPEEVEEILKNETWFVIANMISAYMEVDRKTNTPTSQDNKKEE